jgi:uncharacterized membrane protein
VTFVVERRGVPAADAVPGGRPRVVGVDVARGLALIGMMATHAFDVLDGDGNPTVATIVAGGRAATTFVLVAGVSLAFLSGGRTPARGPERIGASAGLAVRAVLIGAIGLAMGLLGQFNGIDGILPLYGLLFLLAIPLLGCALPVLVGIAAAATALGPVLIVATAATGSPQPGAAEPSFATLVDDPLGLLVQLLLTGAYPAVVYLGYLCAGLAIGRLDLRNRTVGCWLVAGGLAMAVSARLASAVALRELGGLDRLVAQGDLGDRPNGVTELLWDPTLSASWWYLALPAPHSHTPVDMLHTLGCAAAVLGAALLLTRVPLIARGLSPLAAAGSMSLTLYSAHLVLLATGFLDDEPLLLFLTMAVGALVVAGAWRWRYRQGPLEALVARSATTARREATTRPARALVPLVCVAVLALSFWAGARFVEAPDDSTDGASISDVSDSDADRSDGFSTDAADDSEANDSEGSESDGSDGSDPSDESDGSGTDGPDDESAADEPDGSDLEGDENQ